MDHDVRLVAARRRHERAPSLGFLRSRTGTRLLAGGNRNGRSLRAFASSQQQALWLASGGDVRYCRPCRFVCLWYRTRLYR